MKDDDVKRAIASAEEALAKQEQGEPYHPPFRTFSKPFKDVAEKAIPAIKQEQGEPVIDKSAAIRIATVLGWEPQRTWVGLTDEEAQWLYDNCRTPANLIDMTEAKLKEKNND